MISEAVTTKISKSTFLDTLHGLATAKVGLAHYNCFRGEASHMGVGMCICMHICMYIVCLYASKSACMRACVCVCVCVCEMCVCVCLSLSLSVSLSNWK